MNDTEAKVRCAIYTRKSTDENMNLEFTSLDNQRQRAEHYIASQPGWIVVDERYDDAACSGANLERPALQRLLSDVADGTIETIVVYRADRLSRNLRDFGELIAFFDEHNVTFTSVTESFSTSTPGGRMFLNMLLTFAQYERELVSERTRHKIAAARQRGQWTGGRPILGYDLVRQEHGSRIVINEDEARQVRAMFDLYLKHESIITVVKVANERGWTTKRWTSKAGKPMGGQPFCKSIMHHLLTNITYIGKTRYREEVYEGQHDGIIDPDVWERVQRLLKRNAHSGGRDMRNKHGALLRGLLHCSACGRAMTHTYTKKRHALYRYYRCTQAQGRGAQSCPSRSLPAGEIERFIVDQIRTMGSDDDLCTEVIAAVRGKIDETMESLDADRQTLVAEINRDYKQIEACDDPVALSRIGSNEKRLRDLDIEIERLQSAIPTSDEIEQVLVEFDSLWETLPTREQVKLIALLIERIDYDGSTSDIAIHFHPTALQAMRAALGTQSEVAA